ncbi:MAG: hypothetical protein PHR16_11810 [Methylovulum sp.]|nr:hypothetical protein [Methylovulum sp.]
MNIHNELTQYAQWRTRIDLWLDAIDNYLTRRRTKRRIRQLACTHKKLGMRTSK